MLLDVVGFCRLWDLGDCRILEIVLDSGDCMIPEIV